MLCLGAGVSKGCNLPDWVELLSRVAERCPHHQHSPTFVRELVGHGFSLPAVASILESCMQAAQLKFPEQIRHALYRDFPFYKEDLDDKSSRDAFVKFVQDKNSTLRSIAALCVESVPANPGQFRRNRSIHAVVNLNVDATLTKYVRSRYRSRVFRTVERAFKLGRPELISMYHMHGHLSFQPKRMSPKHESADGLVFTEQQYFDFFNRPNSMFNYTMLSLLHDRRLVFVGLSLKDDNIRRLLHYSAKEYAETPGYKDSREVNEAKPIRHFAILSSSGMSGDVIRATEDSLKRLGTATLWISGYDELPAGLKSVYEASGRRWDDVF